MIKKNRLNTTGFGKIQIIQSFLWLSFSKVSLELEIIKGDITQIIILVLASDLVDLVLIFVG